MIKRNSSPTEAQLEAAARWHLRLREESSEELQQEFSRWLDKDSLHKEAWARLQMTWLATQLPRDKVEALRREACETLKPRVWRMPGRFVALGLAAVASLALVVVIVLQPFNEHVLHYETTADERLQVRLADGSALSLDSRSRLQVHYDQNQRLLVLDSGQVLFDVAHDATRPFRVHVADSVVTALGTRFTVDLLEPAVVVTLINGRVSVASGVSVPIDATQRTMAPRDEASIELKPAEQVVIPRQPGRPIELKWTSNVNNVMAWEQGKIILQDEPLERAAARFNRYAGEVVLEVAPAVSELRISGVFDTHDTPAFVEAVAAYLPVVAVDEAGGRIRLVARH